MLQLTFNPGLTLNGFRTTGPDNYLPDGKPAFNLDVSTSRKSDERRALQV